MLAWLLCCAVMLWLYHGSFATLGFRDPDDAMRLAQVRDWIGGQAFYDVSQHRVNPPVGGPMHWSRIVDMPVAAIILMLRPIVGAAMAERAACIIVPLLLLGGTMSALFVAARRIAGPAVALASVVLLATAPTILVQFMPLRIDHHGWQILLAGVALAGAMDGRARRGGIVAGGAIALWLQISSEALPYAALFAALFACRHWIAVAQAPRFVAFALTLGGGAIGLLALLRGPGAVMAPYCDALSFAYVWPLVAMAGASGGLAALIGVGSARRRLLVAAGGGGAAVATFLVTGGPCLSGDPFAALGPLAYRLWYLQVAEGRPIWEQGLALKGIIMLTPALGLTCALVAARRTRDEARMRWLALALLIVGATGVSLFVMRALTVAHLFALPAIGWMLAGLLVRVQRSGSALVRVTGTVLLIAPSPAGLSAGWAAASDAIRPEPAGTANKASANCRTARALAPLRAMPDAVLLAPIDLGPDILVRTRHSVIGTAHHRNAVGIATVIRAFVEAPDAARRTIAGTRATYVVGCAALNEMRAYARENPRGLAAMLAANRAPGWLEPVPVAGPLRLYRIRRAGS